MLIPPCHQTKLLFVKIIMFVATGVIYVCALLLIEQGKHCLICVLNFGCSSSLYSSGVFMTIIMFSVIIVNTKVVANLYIQFILKFHDHRPDGLGVRNF